MGYKGALCWKKKKKDVRTDGGTLKKTLRGKGNIDEQKIVRESQKGVDISKSCAILYSESQRKSKSNEGK